jgi:V/A-type H+/Na+-transporting ATPase subunit I
MLRPAKLSRITIVASRHQLRPIIEKLYSLQAVHFVEFSEGRDPALEGFKIGKPMPEGQATSERLVRLRGLARHLELGEHEPMTRHAARDIDRRLDDQIAQLELNVNSAAETRARIAATKDSLEKERAQLQNLKDLPLRVEDYTGYQSLAVFVGRAESASAVESAVKEVAPEAEVFVASSNYFAVFAPKARASKAAEVIARAGGQLVEAPKGSGSVQERLDAIERELQQLAARLEGASQALAKFRQQHADFLVAAEEHLSIQADKAEAPLAFATTDHAFVAQCWADETEVQGVYSTLRAAVGDKFHFEVEKAAAHPHHAHEAPAQGQEAAESHAGAEAETEADITPTKFRLSRPFRPFQMFTEMVSVPRHDEIDPTPVLALVLPLFLGFMIGDAGYGLLMLALGIWLVAKFGPKMPEAKDIGLALAVSGALALLFGAFIFADAFGIPFGPHAGMHCEGAFAVHGAEREVAWSCLFGSGAVVQPVISKLTNVSDLLVLSVVAAFVHMALGLGFGVVNSWSHSKKHVVAKVGWFALMIGFFTQIFYMAQANRIAGAIYDGLGIPDATIPVLGVQFHLALLGGMVLAAILLAIGEGPITVLELPTMLSNLMSYTRLAGLAVAKGAMAAAFTSLTLGAMVLEGGSIILLVVGLVLFVITQLFVFVLGVFSSAIQAIRLNYVEFFNKFYQGGGVPFTPFGRKRKHTVEV